MSPISAKGTRFYLLWRQSYLFVLFLGYKNIHRIKEPGYNEVGPSDFYGAHGRVLHPSTEWILNYILCIRLKPFTSSVEQSLL